MWSTGTVEKEEGFVTILKLCRLDSKAVITLLGKTKSMTLIFYFFAEERKPSIQEIASQKGIVQRANGWRVQHIAGQIDELVHTKT